MMPYYQGNLALDKQHAEPLKKQRPRQQQTVVQEPARTRPAPVTLPIGVKLFRLAAVIFTVCVLVFIMYRYTQIYQMNLDIRNAKAEINEMKAENSSLKQQIETLQSPERLKEYAIANGFKQPVEGQVSQVERKVLGKTPAEQGTAKR